MPPDFVVRNPDLEKRLLEYILAVTGESDRFWDSPVPGATVSQRGQLSDWRERYRARRSVAELYSDAKNEPFPRASNLGVGIESIFGERLIPTLLANTVDLEPMCQAVDAVTGEVDDALTTVHDRYLRSELGIRDLEELSNREVLTVGSVIHKWTWGSLWKQTEVPLNVFIHPLSEQPIMRPDPQTGGMEPILADPQTPQELWPVDPATGIRLKLAKVSSVKIELAKQGPQLSIRPLEAIELPSAATQPDPNDWDWVADNFTVSPWWFLGREGDPFDGKLQNLEKLWNWIGLNPASVWQRPTRKLVEPIKLKEWHGKFPVTRSGKPVEIVALIATDAKLLLAWRVSPFSRRPFFNRQVWGRQESPFGIGIPESVFAIRGALDALLNQDIDAGNLYNHPPLLLSTLAMLEDEDYETVGPGTVWTMQDINGARFLPPPVAKRDPIAMMNWLLAMTQRQWGVTDLQLGAPTPTLSPNVRTATGAAIVQSEGNVKFGHLTKRIEATRSKELQFLHQDMFANLLTHPKPMAVNGQVIEVERKFFRSGILVRAAGDGLFTNPTIRQQVIQQVLAADIASQNPFTIGDLENYWKLTKMRNEASGLKLALKEPQEVQSMRLLMELIKTPIGQRHVQQAMAELQLAAQTQAAQTQPTNGGRF